MVSSSFFDFGFSISSGKTKLLTVRELVLKSMVSSENGFLYFGADVLKFLNCFPFFSFSNSSYLDIP